MRVLALDFGSARTGVAVSDETGTLARPVGVVEKAASDAGLARLAELVATEEGEHGAQARETEAFVDALRERLVVPVETYDERFTTSLAQQTAGRAAEDAVAAAHLLQGWLERAR